MSASQELRCRPHQTHSIEPEAFEAVDAASASSAPSAFSAVPLTPNGHFVLCLYDAVFHLINHLRRLNEVTETPLEAAFERFPFLGEYFGEMREQMPDDLTWGDASVWWHESIAAWEARCQRAAAAGGSRRPSRHRRQAAGWPS